MISHEKIDGLFVAILSGKQGNMSHTVGIDAGNFFYNCMEDKRLRLNGEILSICCCPNKEFYRIEIASELK